MAGEMKVDLTKIFFESSEDGNLEKVKACVTLGVDINSVSKKYGTGLCIAARNNDLELLEYLLSCPGIDVNQPLNRNSADLGL